MKKEYLLALIAVAMIIGAGLFLYSVQFGTPESQEVTEEQNIFAGLEGLMPGDTVHRDGYTIEVLPSDEVISAPDKYRPVPKNPKLDQVTQDAAEKSIRGAIAMIENEPTNFVGWAALASARALVGDFEGAEEVYLYVTALYPRDADAFANLGSFYAYNINDDDRAIVAYERARTLNPNAVYVYQELMRLYEQAKNQEKVVAILKEGIESNPKEVGLRVILGNHYRDVRMLGEARRVYTQARDLAQDQGEENLVRLMNEELKKLGS